MLKLFKAYLIGNFICTSNLAIQQADQHVRHLFETSLVDLAFDVSFLSLCECYFESIGGFNPEKGNEISCNPSCSQLKDKHLP